MSWKNVDKLQAEFDKLSVEQRYNYFENRFGELIGDIWKNWEDELVEDEIKYLKSLQR